MWKVVNADLPSLWHTATNETLSELLLFKKTDLTKTHKHSLTQYWVSNQWIRELLVNVGDGFWLTYLPIRLCFLKPQLFFFSLLKAFQSDKPPVLPPTGWMMLLSRQPQDNPPPPDTLPLFGPVTSFEAQRQRGTTLAEVHTVNTHTYTLIRRHGGHRRFGGGTGGVGRGADKGDQGPWVGGCQPPHWELTGQTDWEDTADRSR